jgi:SH3 domain protein
MQKLFMAAKVLLLSLLFAAGPALAETMYVTDMLQLELYETMEMTGRPLKRLKSGDRMEVLQREGRYARVRLDGGDTGWVKSLYLVEQEPARAQLNKVDKELVAARERIVQLEGSIAERDAELDAFKSSEEGEASQTTAMLAELDTLRTQNEDLQSRVNAYAGSVPMSWLFIGLLATFVAGWIGSWYTIDRRSRARHGGYRVY